jgi:hypothetical protein
LNLKKEVVMASGEPLDFRTQSTAGTTAFVMSNAVNVLKIVFSAFFVLLAVFAMYVAQKT